jgi:hypothetical protein
MLFSHGLMENRSGLLVGTRLTRISGHAERLAAPEMIEANAGRPRAITIGADRGYDAADLSNSFVRSTFDRMLRKMSVAAAPRSTAAQRGMPATPRVYASASESRKLSGG